VNENPDAMEEDICLKQERYDLVSGQVHRFVNGCGYNNGGVQGVLQEEDVHNA
jgi:hypothetical protein